MRTRPGVMPIAACSSGDRLTWVLVAEWHTSVSGPAERRRRAGDAQAVEHRPGGVDAAGEVDGEHRRQARTAGAPRARAAGGRAGRGSGPAATPGWSTSASATRRATAAWWRWRTASVRMPRSPLSASYGEALAPCSTA